MANNVEILHFLSLNSIAKHPKINTWRAYFESYQLKIHKENYFLPQRKLPYEIWTSLERFENFTILKNMPCFELTFGRLFGGNMNYLHLKCYQKTPPRPHPNQKCSCVEGPKINIFTIELVEVMKYSISWHYPMSSKHEYSGTNGKWPETMLWDVDGWIK